MQMAMRKHNMIVVHVALAALLAATGAAADTETVWQPRIAVTGGYDDNVLVTGQGGGAFGQVSPGLKLDIYGEHQLRVGFDCQVGLAGLSNSADYDSLPNLNNPPATVGLHGKRLFADENCALNTRVHLTERDRFIMRASATYAQDPFALADLGLLLRPGQTDIFVGRLTVEDTHALSGHTGVNYGLDGAILTFGSGDPGNNYVLAPRVRYEWKTSQRSKWDLGVREQIFFGLGSAANPGGKTAGLLGEGHSLLLGYTYDLTQWADVSVRGGPALLTADTGVARNSGTAAMPTLRGELNAYTPAFDIRLTVGHDLVIGSSGGGALVGDIAEVGGTHRWDKLAVHARIGAYRNASVFDQYAPGTSGYGGEAGFDWSFTRELKFSVSALRDARIYDGNAGQGSVDRDVFQVRLTYEKARFN
jgi:hypothetical protein